MSLVTPTEFAAWQRKIDRLNARAVRRGFTGRVSLSGISTKIINDGRFEHAPAGAEVVMIDAMVTGEAPHYGDWMFVAALEQLTADGASPSWLVHYAPGAEDAHPVDRDRLQPGWCDHCRTRRANRRHLLAVRHHETGELKQVGSTCVKDFLGGWSTTPVFLSTRDAVDELERIGGWPDAFTPRTVVAAALAATAAVGWVSRTTGSDLGRPATADLVDEYLNGTGAASARAAELLAPYLEPADREVDAVLAAVDEALSEESTEYGMNLAAVLRSETVARRQFGLACSAVAVHQRIQRRAREEAEPTPTWSWLGRVGERVTLTGRVRTTLSLPGFHRYSAPRTMVIITAGTTLAKVVTSASWALNVSAGDAITIEATVKEHAEYRGDRQTVLHRPRRIPTADPEQMPSAS